MDIRSPDTHEQSKGYSEDFKAKCKAEFPDDKGIHRALDGNSDFIGRWLERERHFRMQPEDIVAIFESGDEQVVLFEAKRSSRIRALYNEWSKEWDEIQK